MPRRESASPGRQLVTLVSSSYWRLSKEAEVCQYHLPLDLHKIIPAHLIRDSDDLSNPAHVERLLRGVRLPYTCNVFYNVHVLYFEGKPEACL